MRADDPDRFPGKVQSCESGLHLRRVGTPVNRAHDEYGIVGGNVRQLLLDRGIPDPLLRFFDEGVVVPGIRHGRFELQHVRAGQALYEFCVALGIALVEPAAGTVLVSPAEIDDQALAHILTNLLSPSSYFI